MKTNLIVFFILIIVNAVIYSQVIELQKIVIENKKEQDQGYGDLLFQIINISDLLCKKKIANNCNTIWDLINKN